MLSITHAAQMHLSKMAEEYQSNIFRLFLKKRGCSGFEYRIDVAAKINDDDEQYNYESFTVIVDKSSLIKYFQGLVIDMQENDFAKGLIFKNPNATGSCGCGESVNFD